MFHNIANIFNTPTTITRNYQHKPSLKAHRLRHLPTTSNKPSFKDHQFQDIMQCLDKPIQTWIIQKQPYLKSYMLNKAIYLLIIESGARCAKNKGDEGAKITVHNLFVLIVQYKILNQFIKEMGTEELELMMDGVCGVFLKEEEGPLDELTCLLHFIVSNCKMHTYEIPKDNLIIFRPIKYHQRRLQNLIRIYGNLQVLAKGKFIDIVVNVIPLFVELFTIILKIDKTHNTIYLLNSMPWIHDIGLHILQLISTHIAIINHPNELPLDSHQHANTNIFKRLHQKAMQLSEIQGFASYKALFNFAYKQLYYFQHVLRLHKVMMEMLRDNEQIVQAQQQINLELVKMLLSIVCEYDLNLPDTSIKSFTQIISNCLYHGHTCFSLYLPTVTPSLQEFIEDMKSNEIYQINSKQVGQLVEGELQFVLVKEENMINYLVQLIFNLKLQYLSVLTTIFLKMNKHHLQNLQFYLIKNNLLHFLIQELHSIHTNNKQYLANYFQLLSFLTFKNVTSYLLLNQIITEDIKDNGKSILIEYIKKNFIYSKEFLLNTIADTISINTKYHLSHFLPQTLEHLLYNGNRLEPNTKHDVWVSYIQDVVIRELKGKREKNESDQTLTKQINQWTTLAMLIQIEYMTFKKGSDLDLGQFTMGYLTNILSEAIKWKHQDDTSVMRRLLEAYQEWEVYYSTLILEGQRSEDVIQLRWGPTINFLYLRKWNRKICTKRGKLQINGMGVSSQLSLAEGITMKHQKQKIR